MEIGKGEFPYTNCALGFATLHVMPMVERIAVEWLEIGMNA